MIELKWRMERSKGAEVYKGDRMLLLPNDEVVRRKLGDEAADAEERLNYAVDSSGEVDHSGNIAFVERRDDGEVYENEGTGQRYFLPPAEVQRRIEPPPIRECHRCNSEITIGIENPGEENGRVVWTCDNWCAAIGKGRFREDDETIPHFWTMEGVDIPTEDNPFRVK